MGSVIKPPSPPKPPKPPAPLPPTPTQAEPTVQRSQDEARRRALATASRSILTSAGGLTSPASTAKKTLLGA